MVPPQMHILNMVIPILLHFGACYHKKKIFCFISKHMTHLSRHCADVLEGTRSLTFSQLLLPSACTAATSNCKEGNNLITQA